MRLQQQPPCDGPEGAFVRESEGRGEDAVQATGSAPEASKGSRVPPEGTCPSSAQPTAELDRNGLGGDSLADLLLEPSWRVALSGEFSKAYFLELQRFVQSEMLTQRIFPPRDQVTNQAWYLPL